MYKKMNEIEYANEEKRKNDQAGFFGEVSNTVPFIGFVVTLFAGTVWIFKKLFFRKSL